MELLVESVRGINIIHLCIEINGMIKCSAVHPVARCIRACVLIYVPVAVSCIDSGKNVECMSGHTLVCRVIS